MGNLPNNFPPAFFYVSSIISETLLGLLLFFVKKRNHCMFEHLNAGKFSYETRQSKVYWSFRKGEQKSEGRNRFSHYLVARRRRRYAVHSSVMYSCLCLPGSQNRKEKKWEFFSSSETAVEVARTWRRKGGRKVTATVFCKSALMQLLPLDGDSSL